MRVQENVPKPFIVGSSRSGTSLLRSMLNAHPLLAIPPETHFIPSVARACAEAEDPRTCFIDGVLRSRNWSLMALDERMLREQVSALDPFTVSEAIRGFFELYASQQGKTRWGDKTPMYAGHMELIQDQIPEASFIHIIRDGRDVSLSALPLMRRQNPEATLEDAARYWVRRVTATRRKSAKVRNYLEVRYENIIQNTEPELRRICEYINLAWDPVLLRYYAQKQEEQPNGKVATSTPTRAPERRENLPPDPTRMHRWQSDMSHEELAGVEAITGTLLAELGYGVG